MPNPLRSEAEAFHFLLLVVAVLGVTAIASLAGGAFAGLPVFLVATGIIGWLYLRGRRHG